MGNHVPHDQPPNSSSAPDPRQPYIPWAQQRQFFHERMSQHKYNPRQMLFVKNVPQESAMRIAGLYTQYKPLETKNLYPDSRITTFMIALPNVGATEEALRETDGLKVGNTVLTVERYNPKQSIVARRDARKRHSAYAHSVAVNDLADYSYDEDEHDGYKADEEKRVNKGTPKAAKLVAKQSEVPLTPPRTRRVSASGGISWANVAGGTQPERSERRSPSPVPPVAEDNQQQTLDKTESFPAVDHDARREDVPALIRPPAIDARLDTRFLPPGRFTPAVALPLGASPPRIAVTPPTASPGPRPVLPQILPQLLSSSTPSYDQFYTAPEGPTPPQATQTQSSESSRVEEDSSQQTQVPNVKLMQRGMFAMPGDTTAFMRRRHRGDCEFCKLRMRSELRANNQDN